MNIIKRAKLPTPRFFRILRNIGLLLAGAGAAVLASPVQLHHTIVDVAGYLALAGSVISAVSQVTVDQDKDLQDGTGSNTDIKTKENERP